jgi:SAM-dependent methyltransferase
MIGQERRPELHDRSRGNVVVLLPPAHDNRHVDKPWMLDELAHAGPEHLDPTFVASFDRKQGYPDPGEDIATLRTHGLDAGSTVIDLGAGTGRFALAAAHEFGQVIAADVSPAMVTWLRREAAVAGLTNLHCVKAGFLSYEHVGPTLTRFTPDTPCTSCPTSGRPSHSTASLGSSGPAGC